jgi:hypothetical protein
MKGYVVNRRLKGKNGKYRWFNTQVVPVFDTKGEFRFWSGCCLDMGRWKVKSHLHDFFTFREKRELVPKYKSLILLIFL